MEREKLILKIEEKKEQIKAIENEFININKQIQTNTKFECKGLIVKHKLLGKGEVIIQEDSLINVKFGNQEMKKFRIPVVFTNNFLSCEDDNFNKELNKFIKLNEIKKELEKEKELKINELKNLEKEYNSHIESLKNVDIKDINIINEKTNFYINRGYIEVKDNAVFKTLKDISDLFNKGYKGLQKCCVKTGFDTEYFWCPKLEIDIQDKLELEAIPYLNIISQDKEYIYETRKEDALGFVKDMILYRNEDIRITFPKYNKLNGYIFEGIYEMDVKATKEMLDTPQPKVVWRRINVKVELNKYFNK